MTVLPSNSPKGDEGAVGRHQGDPPTGQEGDDRVAQPILAEQEAGCHALLSPSPTVATGGLGGEQGPVGHGAGFSITQSSPHM
jgi:hypothetical protein